jgi:hypothetical protein
MLLLSAGHYYSSCDRLPLVSQRYKQLCTLSRELNAADFLQQLTALRFFPPVPQVEWKCIFIIMLSTGRRISLKRTSEQINLETPI